MTLEFLILLIAALITACFLFWIEFANRKVKERTRHNKNNKTKIVMPDLSVHLFNTKSNKESRQDKSLSEN